MSHAIVETHCRGVPDETTCLQFFFRSPSASTLICNYLMFTAINSTHVYLESQHFWSETNVSDMCRSNKTKPSQTFYTML